MVARPVQNVPQARSDTRFIGDVPGSFVFLDRRGAEWDSQVFPFMARSVSGGRAVVTTEAEVRRGERVALRFEGVGIRRGVVERTLREGFIASLVEEGAGEIDVEARIDWLKRKSRGRAEDKRVHKRVLPRDTGTLLVLGADNFVEARIRDMSQSGAAVESPVEVPIGQLLALGAVLARVVRTFPGGFAVRFLELQDIAELEGLLTLRTRREKKLAAEKLGFAA